MNITLRCRGSKREQARPPICAARRRHTVAQAVEAVRPMLHYARVRPSRPYGYRCLGILFLSPLPRCAASLRRAAGAFFSLWWTNALPLHCRRTRPPRLSRLTRSSESRACCARRRVLYRSPQSILIEADVPAVSANKGQTKSTPDHVSNAVPDNGTPCRR